jgi:suppressor of ftsI
MVLSEVERPTNDLRKNGAGRSVPGTAFHPGQRRVAMLLGSLAPSIRVCALLGVALDAVLTKNGTPAFSFAGREGVAPTIRLEPGERIEVALHDRMHAQAARSNDVNLHFHGLAVSPLAPGDDSLTMLAHPGQTLHYVVRVPANHPPGLYWYHPHVHGQTFWQVAHGMSGAIVIEGMQRHLPALAAMRERIVILRQSPTGRDINEASNAPTNPEALEDADGNPCRPELALHPTIDGLATETFAIGRGERQYFRVVNASASRYFDLSIDGVPLQLVALATILGRLEVDASATPSPAQPLVAATKLAQNVMDEPPPPPALVRTVRLTEDANHFYIDGKTFDMQAMMRQPAFVARAGTVEAWNVINDTDEVHDFHVHQVHFAEESVDGVTLSRRHWVDTVSIPSRIHHWNRTEPGRARLLVDFRNPIVRGTFLLHCHILDHEDRGMMAKIEVR